MAPTPLHLEIPQDLPGFDRFFGSWVIKNSLTVMVDVGPANSAGRLLAGLEAEGIDRIDWVLLTHIHIDHAGALGQILARYPMAKAVCHAKGLRFVVDPTKLWEGSRQVLGVYAEAYGRPDPISADRLVPHTAANIPALTIVETPGHAVHHLAFRLGDRLFSGEAGGNLLKVQGREYLRPATPVRFFLPEALASVDRMLALPDGPIHTAHFEEAYSSQEILGRFRQQLWRWRDIIAAVMATRQPDMEIACREALLAQDPELAAFALMDPAAQEREKNFIINSVRGYLGYLQENTANGPESK